MLEDSMKIYLRYDGALSLADAVTVHVMNTRGIGEVASFDSDFDKVDGIIRWK
jgi:predicted nucleic acid-binding protein